MNSVIYYPHIHPTPDWFRIAALCWDRIYRLSSRDALPDPPVIQQMNEHFGGALESLDVHELARGPHVQEQFFQWIDTRREELGTLAWPAELSSEDKTVVAVFPGKIPGGEFTRRLTDRGLARIERRDVEVQVPSWMADRVHERHMEVILLHPRPKFWSSEWRYEWLRQRASAYGWTGRVARGLKLDRKARQIREAHLVTVTDYSTVAYMRQDVASYFLSVCGAHAAAERKCDLVTDAQHFTAPVFHGVAAMRGEIAHAVLQAYVPDSLSAVEVTRIAELRRQLAASRLKYQQAVQSLVADCADIASDGELHMLSSRMTELAREQVDEVLAVYRRTHVETTLKAFGLSVTPPALLTTVASVLGVGIFVPAGIAATLALFSAQLLLDREKVRSERSKSPWSYVLSVAQGL